MSRLFSDAENESSRHYYGWVVIGLTFLTMAIGGSIVSTFPVFYQSFLEEFGWSRADTALAFSASMVTFALAAGPVGALVGRWGPRVVVPTGVGVLGIGLFLMSHVSNLLTLCLYYGVVVALGVTLLGMIPTSTVVSQWFVKYRSTAMGIAHAGRPVGSMIMAPLAASLILWIGWRSTYLWLAVGILFILMPINLMFHRGRSLSHGKNQTEGEKEGWTLQAAMHDQSFWLLFLSGIFQGVSFSVIGVHQVAHMVDIGFTINSAAWLLGFMALLRALGGVGGGWLGDRAGRRLTFLVSSVLGMFGIVCLMALTADRWILAYIFVLFYGIGAGARGTSFVSLKADIFPGRNFGRILGYSQMGAGLASGLGPWAAGYIYDSLGSYQLAFWLVLGMNFLSLGTGYLATRRVAGR